MSKVDYETRASSPLYPMDRCKFPRIASKCNCYMAFRRDVGLGNRDVGQSVLNHTVTGSSKGGLSFNS